MVDITVIVCTYNRSRSLAESLESIAASKVSAEVQWEVLVVDNNSMDDTQEVVQSFCQRSAPRFRYVFESRQGLSFARNTGVREALGSILAFTDDDVIVDSMWLQNLVSPLKSGDYAGAGGRVLAANSFDRPGWLALQGPYNMGGMLALFDCGDGAGRTNKPPFGANMSYRKEMFQKHGLFRTDLGRRPASLLSNEDTEFGRRLIAKGERLLYEPSAVVYHPVPEYRVKKSYFLRFWFNLGRSDVRESGRRPDIWRIPRYYLTIPKIAFTVLVSRTLRWLSAYGWQRRFFLKGMVWMTVGQMVEYYRMWHDRAPLQEESDILRGTTTGSNAR